MERERMPGYVHRMDEGSRRQLMNPEAILAEIGLKPGHTFVDVGCGDGFFSLPAARIVGAHGRICALDVDSERIDELRKKAAGEALSNLDLRAGAGEETVFCHGCADLVFFGNVLHDFQDPAKVLRNAREMLKGTGKLANYDWVKTATEFGPPLSIRLDERTAGKLMESNGFRVEAVHQSGPHHYLIIAAPA
jgi:ubiquinone/menaquinone biosynthesis C-methylase UbiE